MKIWAFTVIVFYGVLSDGRLTQKSNRTTSQETPAAPTPFKRLARDTSDEDIHEFSKEEFQFFTFRPKNRLQRLTIRHDSVPLHDKTNRVTRDFSEQIESKTSTEPYKSPGKLNKKPTPKFNDIDYEEDFQMKMYKSQLKFSESSEHEDEDFNLEDYDFDVNHDEFIGRGKPLEPRIKNKKALEHQLLGPEYFDSIPADSSPGPPIIKPQSTVIIQKTVQKRDQVVDKVTKKVADKVKNDYEDDTTTMAMEDAKPRDLGDDMNEDNEDSRDYERKVVRAARSSWNRLVLNKVGEKANAKFGKFLRALPMFPANPAL